MTFAIRQRLLAALLSLGFISVAPLAGLAESPRDDAEPGSVRSAADARDIDRVERYLNRIDSMRARFIQVASDGSYIEGDVYLDRPGRLRFEYDPPHPALLVSNGQTLLYYDRQLEEATYLPLSQTPVWFLVRPEIRLKDPIRVTEIKRREGVLFMTLEDREAQEDAEVTLEFLEDPLTLSRWQIADGQGNLTQIALVRPEFGVAIDPALFDYGEIDLPRPQPGSER